MAQRAKKRRAPSSLAPKSRMPSAASERSSGGRAGYFPATVGSSRLSERAMSRACSASLSSDGSQKPEAPSRGRQSASANASAQAQVGTRPSAARTRSIIDRPSIYYALPARGGAAAPPAPAPPAVPAWPPLRLPRPKLQRNAAPLHPRRPPRPRSPRRRRTERPRRRHPGRSDQPGRWSRRYRCRCPSACRCPPGSPSLPKRTGRRGSSWRTGARCHTRKGSRTGRRSRRRCSRW